MKYLSLYRKYRPIRFEDVVEQDYVVKILRNQVETKNIANAYLFTGTRGTGKTTVARIFARAINCDSPINGSPCGVCPSCKTLAESNTDIYELDAASNNGVDNIREIRDGVQYQPLYAKYKVYIIDEVHQLTGSAFNAFLKTLEEPPEYCVFILATTDPQKIPQTILSRCLKLDFRLVSIEGLTQRICQILDNENVAYEESAVNLIAEAGAGSVRDSLSVLEACISASDGKITYETALNVLGANNPEFIGETCKAIVSGDVGYALSQVQYASDHGKSITIFLQDIVKYLRDLMIIRTDPKAKSYLKLPSNVFDKAKIIADSFGSDEIIRCLDTFTSLDYQLKTSATPKFLLETAIAKCASQTDNSILGQSSRIEAIERKIEKGITVTKVVKEVEIRVSSGVSPIPNSSSSDMTEPTQLPFDVDLPKTENSTNNDNPIQSTEDVKNTEKTVEKPTQKQINRAKSQKLRNALISEFNKLQLVFVYTVLTDRENYVIVSNEYVDILLNNKFDVEVVNKHIDVIKRVVNETFGEDYNVSVKYNENKSNEESFLDQFSQNKIIVKK